MRWSSLLSMHRINNDGNVSLNEFDPNRTEFQRDYDRILLSSSFRRLRDKTQVFALSENDHVHSRLTHSLVVSSVGRSLGTAIGRQVISRNPEEFMPAIHNGITIDHGDFGDIVAAACLAHDIGNPPFGHSGEDAIGRFFENFFAQNKTIKEELSELERLDFEKFEGNAQGFRILTKTLNHAAGGLQLTAATLGTFLKYPRESGDLEKKHPELGVISKKPGFTQAEKSIFEATARTVGLERASSAMPAVVYRRHPLAFLVEAADDITYRVLDIDDGLHLGYVSPEKVIDCFERIASRKPTYRRIRWQSPRESFEYLRGAAISNLRDEVCRVFLDNHDGILAGTYKQSLFDEIESRGEIRELRQIMEEQCYKHHSVIEIELAGYEVLGGLLKIMVEAVTAPNATKRHKHAMNLIGLSERPPGSLYKKLLCVTDYVSGMTDRFAVSLYRKLHGVSLPTGSR